MNSQSSDSEGQGFYKPAIQITTPTEPLPPSIQYSEEDIDDPIAVVTEDRPTDFMTRTLSSIGTLYQYHQALQMSTPSQAGGEVMKSIAFSGANREKQKRYASLEAKYSNNPAYKLVYSRREGASQYSSYYFSLENTTDYNPRDYCPVREELCPEEGMFDSRFESGNLQYAYQKVGESGTPEYDLIMQNDTNTRGYSQWFYFLFRNGQQERVKFNIVNFTKKRLMFLDGVRPVAFSIKQSQSGMGWSFQGQNLQYKKSYVTREIKTSDGSPSVFKNYYTLSFQLSFSQQGDTTYLALNHPYTYSKMLSFVDQICAHPPENVEITKSILCYSISNNAVPYLRIKHQDSYNPNVVLCFGRQHPGQTVGSYVLEGFVRTLLSDKKLLKKYEFIVIPMTNPDGVIYGNFRTNAAGFDLNRQWLEPNRWLHPEVYFLNRLILAVKNIEFCLDFHGHSKKLNSFIYACTSERVSEFRVYPYVYSKCCKLFSLPDCTYNITPDKVKTARVRVFNEIRKPYVYTLETSFFGHNQNGQSCRFTLEDLQEIGRGGAEALGMIFADKKSFQRFEQEVKDKSFMFEQWALVNRQDYGSESNPSEDELDPVERKKKVMSDAKVLKPSKKERKNKRMSKKDMKGKRLREKEQVRFVMKQKADSATFIEERPGKIPPKKEPKEVSIDYGVVIIQDKKQRREIAPMYLQPKLKGPPPITPRHQQIKTMGSNALSVKKEKAECNTTNSNLFDTARFFQLRDQSFKKKQESLEICNVQKIRPNDTVHEKSLVYGLNSRNSSFKRRPLEDSKASTVPKKKNRQKVYIIRENKVVNSITRIHEEDVKSEIEKEISSRTMILKNCQKIMSSVGLEHKHLSSVGLEPRHLSIDRSGSRPEVEVEDPYKTKKLLRPLDIRRHRNFNSLKEEKQGIFFSFF